MIPASIKQKIVLYFPKPLLKPILKTVRVVKLVYYKVIAALCTNNMTVYCPCCEMKFDSFIPGRYHDYPNKFDLSRYEKIRQDIICPYCRSLPRHRILALWCDAHIEMLRSVDILYFALEYSMAYWMKRNNISYTSADLYADADLRLDIQAIDLPDESYDIIFCNHVLEHVDFLGMALKEIYRVLRNNGLFLCSFPMDPSIETDVIQSEHEHYSTQERIKRFGQDDHNRIFGMKADKLLTEAGFVVKTIYGHDYPDEIVPVVGPANYDMNILFCCKKQ